MLSRFARRPFANRGLAFPRLHPLHAMVTGGGYELRDRPPYDFPGQRRGPPEWVLWQYTLAGSGRLTWAGRPFVPLPGTAMLLVMPHDHRYWLPPGGRWQHFYLCLSGREVVAACKEVVARRGPLLELAADHPAVVLAADLCCDLLDGRLTDPFATSAAAYRLAMELLASIHDDGAEALPEPLERALACGRARACQGIGVAELAQAAGLSRHHFSRVFAERLRISPARWLEEQRLHRAARLLREDGATVAAAARAAGYPDPAYFCRAFRRHHGMSPAAYRGMAAR